MRLKPTPNSRDVLFRFLSTWALLLTSLLSSRGAEASDDVSREVLDFKKVYDVVEANFMDPVDPDRAIFDGAIHGMLATLDPFCSFLDAGQFEQHRQFVQGKAHGFGATLFLAPGEILVLQTAPGSPSRRAGLGPGDEIVAVNGQRCDRLSTESLIELLQRVRLQTVRLGVIHPGQVVAHEHDLSPAELPTPTVDKSLLLEPGIGYVHVTSFDGGTPQEVLEAITQLGSNNLKGLLLDLRGNHGGVLDAAIGLASFFLKPEVLIVTQRGRAVREKCLHAVAGPGHFDMALVVLVDGGTAGPAEVLAAALQEHDRAVIAGDLTLGKGVVESVIALGAGSGLTLTTAQYFTPSGRSIQRPLPGTALALLNPVLNAGSNPRYDFRTENGRLINDDGGVVPDVSIPAPERNQSVAALDAHGAFTSFASEYLTTHAKVDRSFEPDAQILGLFRDYLVRNRIRMPEELSAQEQDFLKLRIKAGLLTLIFGLSVGDELQIRSDPQVQRAVKLFPDVRSLLKAPMPSAGALDSPRTNISQEVPDSGISPGYPPANGEVGQ
jgi:carboxyl-terminal processing protease